MKHVITLIPGDGTGPEISAATVKVVEATGVNIEWDIVNAGAEVYEKEGTVLPDNVIESLKKNSIKVSGFHKANIMKYTDGLFLEIFRKIAAEYPDIESEDRIVDNMCMQLVQKPELYDVMVLPNLYGDIVSDLCAGLIGGLGVAPGANIGTEAAVFEAVHGSAPKYADLNKANPTALILSGVLMLRHLGEQAAAEQVETALRE